jgi:hypothetical protein
MKCPSLIPQRFPVIQSRPSREAASGRTASSTWAVPIKRAHVSLQRSLPPSRDSRGHRPIPNIPRVGVQAPTRQQALSGDEGVIHHEAGDMNLGSSRSSHPSRPGSPLRAPSRRRLGNPTASRASLKSTCQRARRPTKQQSPRGQRSPHQSFQRFHVLTPAPEALRGSWWDLQPRKCKSRVRMRTRRLLPSCTRVSTDLQAQHRSLASVRSCVSPPGLRASSLPQSGPSRSTGIGRQQPYGWTRRKAVTRSWQSARFQKLENLKFF